MNMSEGTLRRLIWLSLFAVAMAFLETMVVVYLRRIYYPEMPLSLFPMSDWTPADLFLEIGREISTLVMLLGVAVLSEKGTVRRCAAFLYLFGIWDIFYYVWLKAVLDWPAAWMEWDVLFLIPWAWLAPWWTPVVAAAMFVIWGAAVLSNSVRARLNRAGILLFAAGTALVLISFLQPAWPLLGEDLTAFTKFVPGSFSWGVYAAGIIGIAAGLKLTLRAGPL